ncbi:hypothetical protein [Pleionea sediminis]|uniref:hypothetical protein n=1 Tax=Pleionea sediminis TaxID=2569479 RepID=UPI00118690AC|nr:hypothetical protein [Pleionea sediminis]
MKSAYWLIVLFSSGVAQAYSNIDWNLSFEGVYDQVNDLPNGNERLEGGSLYATYGFEWLPETETFMNIGVSFKSAYSSDNRENEAWFIENEYSTGSRAYEYFWGIQLNPQHTLEIGRKRLSFFLNPMVWDRDLSPTGITYQYQSVNNNKRRFLAVGAYGSTNDINNVDSKMFVADYFEELSLNEMLFRYGLSFIKHFDLELQGNALRQNSLDVFTASDYQLAGLNLGVSHLFDSGQLDANMTAYVNTAVDDENRASRIDLDFFPVDTNLSLSYSYQSVEKDSTVAAFNDDDWWFATAMSGSRASIAYAFSETVGLRTSYFLEELDNSDKEELSRILVSLTVDL